MPAKIAVGGRDEPHVDAERAGAAEPFELVLLEHAQDLGLRAGAHVADFVQEQRAAVGLLEAANPLLVGAGERAFLVPEELRFEEVLLERRAVHLHEVPRFPERVVVDRPGDELLARSRFPANEHRRVALRDLLHDVEHALERRARADDLVEFVDVALGVAEVVDLVLEAPHLERLLDLDLHLLDFERLLDVVERADLHGLDGGVHRSKRRHQDHGGRRVQRARRPQHVHAVAAAHLEVAQDDVERAVVQALDRQVTVGCLLHIVSGFGQPPGEPPPERVVVVSNQNSAHTQSLASRLSLPTLNHCEPLETGSVTLNRVPCPGTLLRSIRPSCASTIFRTIGNPRPEPWGLVVKNGSKIRSLSSTATPGPSSTTSTTTVASGACASLAKPGSCASASAAARMLIVPCPPSASNAFVSRFVNTWHSWW